MSAKSETAVFVWRGSPWAISAHEWTRACAVVCGEATTKEGVSRRYLWRHYYDDNRVWTAGWIRWGAKPRLPRERRWVTPVASSFKDDLLQAIIGPESRYFDAAR